MNISNNNAEQYYDERLNKAETNEKKLSTIINSLPDLVMQIDKDLKITWANKATLRLNPDAIGQICYKALPGRYSICPNCPIVKALKTGQTEYGVVHQKFIPKIGESFWDDIGVPIKDSTGKTTSVVKVARNITEKIQGEVEKKKLESQLRQAMKMESVGRLAGGVAHDFNNMLGVIIGYTDIILDQMDQNHPFHSGLVKIRNAGERSSDLTQQLLAFARKQTVVPKIIDPNKTIKNMLKMLYRLIGEEIDIAWVPGKEIWSIRIDPIQIDQILINLCINARDAINGIGKITIETSNVIFDKNYCKEHAGSIVGEYMLLTVSDNGCGMDDEMIKNIFDPFFTTKVSNKGTGLGLATVYGTVKQNDGFINVYSELDNGTTFKVYLPHYTTQTIKTEEPKTQIIEHGNETVLLVEDEPAILEMITIMLKRVGYKILTADTPKKAITLADKYTGKIDILVTDVIMPEMNGKDLAKKLLSFYPNIKQLFMSGYTANVITRHGVLEEGIHFIQKPFSTESLTVKVREALKD